MLTWPAKDPDEVLDYQINWATAVAPAVPVLQAGETITTSVWEIVTGSVVINQDELADGVTTVWLSGGTDGESCIILNRISTSEGRVYDQGVRLRIRDKEGR